MCFIKFACMTSACLGFHEEQAIMRPNRPLRFWISRALWAMCDDGQSAQSCQERGRGRRSTVALTLNPKP